MSASGPSKTITLVRDTERDWARFPRYELRLHTPGAPVQSRSLTLDAVEIGSGPSCDLVCADARVSRRHCQVLLGDDGLELEDLGSKNGTFVGGVRVTRVWLTPGLAVTFGGSRLEVIAQGDEAQIALSEGPTFGGARGTSVLMRGVFAQLRQAARVEGTLVLWGETGTGKELLARGVHEESPRAEGPFVVLDCGAVPEGLLEDELFGHVPGAFTGAAGDRQGIFEQANGGTLFLDEIGELPLPGQAALLRVLEERRVRPLGASETRPVDVRIIAATHRDLRARIAAGEFRQDLYYRLAVIEVTVPPLRQRLDDLPTLVERFLAEQDPPLTLAALPPGALDMFRRHLWPGNVRELRNVVERFAAFPDQPPVLGEQRGPAHGGDHFFGLPLRQAREAAVASFERAYFRQRLQAHRGSVSAAANAMGVSRQFLYRMLAKYELQSGSDG